MPAAAPAAAGLRVPTGVLIALGGSVVLLLVLAGAVYVGYTTARASTLELLVKRAQSLVEAHERRIGQVIEPVLRQAAWIAGEVAAGRLDPANVAESGDDLRAALAATPGVEGLSIVLADGSERTYFRAQPAASSAVWLAPLARSRHAAPEKRGAWLPPLFDEARGQTLLVRSTPLLAHGREVATLLQGVAVNALSQAQSSGRERERLVPFVLYDRRWVLAHPLLREGWPEADASSPLPGVEGFDDAVLEQLHRLPVEPLGVAPSVFDGSLAVAQVGSRRFRVFFREAGGDGSLPLTIGFHLPEREIAQSYLQPLRAILVLGALLLALALLAAWLLGRALARPVGRLASAARRIRRGQLQDFKPLPRSLLREVDEASSAFNTMVDGLRERELMHDLLGRFLPPHVAADLIRQEGALAPRTSEATVLFVDLAGFSSLAEQVSPAEVVELLNGFFSVAAGLIEQHGGVITQFQGDGLLAVFNVPLPDPRHAANAVRAALSIQQAVRERRFAGRALGCRIGINTGEVIAGCVGSGGRLTYTVHGDAVNLAARLEQLNKAKGTSTLVSGSTAERAPGFDYRDQGTESVRGRAEPVRLFALV